MFIKTAADPNATYPAVFPNFIRGEAYETEGAKWPLAVVALYNGTADEAAACVTALMDGKPYTQWPVKAAQISHWCGGPKGGEITPNF